jgi:hypothetical protein
MFGFESLPSISHRALYFGQNDFVLFCKYLQLVAVSLTRTLSSVQLAIFTLYVKALLNIYLHTIL